MNLERLPAGFGGSSISWGTLSGVVPRFRIPREGRDGVRRGRSARGTGDNGTA
jgi:hypothetical protein